LHLAFRIVAWSVAIVWVYKAIEAAFGLPAVPNLAERHNVCADAGVPRLTVIVPARNEAEDIGACLESLLQQDCAELRIIAVNDRSSDGTGAIMEALASAHPGRLEAMQVAELPAGWLGKSHAMALAARRAIAEGETSSAPPEYLLFTDADVVFHPEILRRALTEAEASGADHLVVLPTMITKSVGEGMLLGYLQVMSLWGVRPWRVGDAGTRDVIGVGAFNLVRVAAYLRIGGFDAIPMAVVEDMTLGRRVKRAGLRQRVATAPGMVSLHWAAGPAGIVRGMTKNIFAVFGFRWWLLLGAAAGLGLMSIGPVVFLGVAGARIPGVLALAAIAGVYLLSGRTSRISAAYGVLFPVAGALVVYSMLRSMVVTLATGGVTWRGTFYPLSELRKLAHSPDGEGLESPAKRPRRGRSGGV
jgi:glycosyltransferase involved in cell wall biosynthesis